MFIIHKTRIDKAAESNPGSARYALDAVEVTPCAEEGQAYAAASDGKMLALTKIEATGLPHKRLIPSTQFAADKRQLRKQPARIADPVFLDGGRFPVLRDLLTGNDPADNEGSYVEIDTRLLSRMAEALNAPGDTAHVLRLFVPKDPVRPIAAVGEEGIGLAMSINNDTEDNARKQWRSHVSGYVDALEHLKLTEKMVDLC